MIYFDNSATGGFKPHAVTEVATAVIKNLCANPSRSGHRLSEVGGEAVYRTRKAIKKFFGCPFVDRVVFTKNCTEALCTAIFGLLNIGDHVVTTCLEHNSVLRPLFSLQSKKIIEFDVAFPSKTAYITQNTLITYSDIHPLIKSNTKLVIVNHASNVTGGMADVKDIANGLKKNFPHVLFMVDGAQSGGHIPINMSEDSIDVLCLAGHKGLLGSMTTGVLAFNNRADILPLTHGGTGSDSFSLSQPEYYPDRLESGTLNLPAIASLHEGITYLETNVNFIGERLKKMTETLVEVIKDLPDVKVYSIKNPIGIVAFSVDGIPSQLLTATLSDRFDIAVRGGYHCAPLMHAYLGTQDEGLVRVSLSPQNTHKELLCLFDALKLLTATASKDI